MLLLNFSTKQVCPAPILVDELVGITIFFWFFCLFSHYYVLRNYKIIKRTFLVLFFCGDYFKSLLFFVSTYVVCVVFLFLSADRGCAGTAVVWERRPRHQPAGPCPNIHAMFSNTISFFSDQSYWELRDITFGIPVSKWISASDKGNWKWQHVWAVAQLKIKRRKLQGFFCGGTMYNNCTLYIKCFDTNRIVRIKYVHFNLPGFWKDINK